jgi:hypothetical protein
MTIEELSVHEKNNSDCIQVEISDIDCEFLRKRAKSSPYPVPIDKVHAHNVCLRLKRGTDEYTWGEFTDWNYKYYLITTRNMTKNTETYLTDNSITVLGRACLY